MPSRLKLTQNAQFYTAKSETISDASITSTIEAAIENIDEEGAPIISVLRNERTTPSGLTYILSAVVYESVRSVYFWGESLDDKIYAYLAIIEIGTYIAVFKKSCANISDAIDENFNLIDHSQLTATFGDDEVEYQKIALRNMTISDRAMRARSYEAMDLKGLFSTHAAGRSVPYFLKIRQGSSLKTISANSGRMVETSDRKGIDEIADWVNSQIHLIQNPSDNKSFLESFAKLVSLETVLGLTSPSGILIESNLLFERVTQNEATLIYKTKKSTTFPLSPARLNALFQALELAYDVEEDLRIRDLGDGSRLRKNTKTLTLHSPTLKKIQVIENGHQVTLQKYIIKNGLFSVCFDDPKYMYFMGRCFEDASGVAEIDSILEILVPKPQLQAVTSEKGILINTSSAFSNESGFSAVEIIHAQDDYIFCDDLGAEWADHITLNSSESCITFIHSKHGTLSTSAGRMHEVVGQGIKNLGHMFFSKEQFALKIASKFGEMYNLDNIQSQISRTRKGDCTVIDPYLNTLLSDFRLHRKCVLSCSFLSKEDVTIEFNKIKAGERVASYVTQLMWIISSFAHAAKDANVIPQIYCLE